jgi:hypothetical protein
MRMLNSTMSWVLTTIWRVMARNTKMQRPNMWLLNLPLQYFSNPAPLSPNHPLPYPQHHLSSLLFRNQRLWLLVHLRDLFPRQMSLAYSLHSGLPFFHLQRRIRLNRPSVRQALHPNNQSLVLLGWHLRLWLHHLSINLHLNLNRHLSSYQSHKPVHSSNLQLLRRLLRTFSVCFSIGITPLF